jgi:hypothetical protein
MAAFVLAPAGTVGLVHVNALFNTPLFERLKECLPEDFHRLEDASKEMGVDLTRDVDRVAVVPGGGMAVSGFFEGKPVAETMISRGGPVDRREYRGQTIVSSGDRCAAQMGNLVLLSPSGKCDAMIDRALNPPAEGAQEELYGDMFVRTDLKQVRGANAPPELQQLIDALEGVTIRANVWDSVALTVEGAPRNQKDARDLARLARGAVAMVKGQLDDEDVELQALADLAQVSSRKDKLEVNVAVPAEDVFERLNFPCAGRDAGP